MENEANEVTVNMQRVQRIARAMARAAERKDIRGMAPSTELFVAAMVCAVLIAQESRPDRTADDIATLIEEIIGHMLLDYRAGHLKIALEKKRATS